MRLRQEGGGKEEAKQETAEVRTELGSTDPLQRKELRGARPSRQGVWVAPSCGPGWNWDFLMGIP